MGFRFRRELGSGRDSKALDEQIDAIQCRVARIAYPFAMSCLGILLYARAVLAAQSPMRWADLAGIWVLSLIAFVTMMGRLFGWTPHVTCPALGGLAMAALAGLAAGTSGRVRPDQAVAIGLLALPAGLLLAGWRLGWFGRLAHDEGWAHALGQALSAAIVLLFCLSGLALVVRYFADRRVFDLARFIAVFAPVTLTGVLFEVWGGMTPRMFREAQSQWVLWGLGMATVTVVARGWEWPLIGIHFLTAYLISRYYAYRRRLAERKMDQLENKPPAG